MPMTLMRAKTTTLRWARFAPVPRPNRVWIHSAPVSTFERRSQPLRNIIRKIWLNTGHKNGSQMLFSRKRTAYTPSTSCR